MARAKKKASLMQIVQRNIKSMRTKRGMTQQQLADAVGNNVQSVSRIENSPQNLCLESIEKIAAALECEFAELVTLDDSQSKISEFKFVKKRISTFLDELERSYVGRDT